MSDFRYAAENVKDMVSKAFFGLVEKFHRENMDKIMNNSLIIRNSPEIAHRERVVLSDNTIKDAGYGLDMVNLFTSLCEYKYEDLMLGADFFINFPDLYFELFKNHSIRNDSRENLYKILRFYRGTEMPQDVFYYQTLENYFRKCHEEKTVPGVILDLFIKSLNTRHTGNQRTHNFKLDRNSGIYKLTDFFTSKPSLSEQRLSWIKIKLYDPDPLIKGDGFTKLQESVIEYLAPDSRATNSTKRDYAEYYLTVVSESLGKAEFSGKIAGFRKSVFKHEYLSHYCEREMGEVRSLYYLSEIKLMLAQEDWAAYRAYLAEKDSLTILIKSSSANLRELLRSVAGTADEDARYEFNAFLIEMLKENALSNEQIENISQIFIHDKSCSEAMEKINNFQDLKDLLQ